MDILVHMQSRILTDSLAHLLSATTPHKVHGLSSWVCRENHPPDVVICDGSNCTEDGRCRWGDSKIILVDTGMGEQEIFYFLVSRKIDGVLTTDMSPEMVGKAIAAVERGDFWLPHRNFRKFLQMAGVTKGGRLPELKEKDRRILELIARGYKNSEIAEALHLSEQTIKSHVSRILRILNVSNRAQLVRLFLDSL